MDDKRAPLKLTRVATGERARLMRLIGGESFDWPSLVSRLPVTGLPLVVAHGSDCLGISMVRNDAGGHAIVFALDVGPGASTFCTEPILLRLAEAIQDDIDMPVCLSVAWRG